MNVELNVNALGKALQRLDESLAYDLAQPLVVDACIQRFEFCIIHRENASSKHIASTG